MPALAPLRYRVRFPRPQSHYAEVEARIPTDGHQELDLFLPVWTPGSYMVREYSRNIESLTATGPGPLAVTKTRKNRWRVSIPEAIDEVLVKYSLYCHELTVRTNYLDESFVLLNGAATFLTLLESPPRAHEVVLELFPGWQGSWSGLSGESNTFLASDYDALVDSPMVAGCPSIHGFDVEGKPHLLINIGDAGLWDTKEAIEDLERIVRCHLAMWGSLPYDRYCFFNLLTGDGGGLEHRNSVVMMADRFATRTRSSYTNWLDLASHEFFHVWNVKRLRPVELGPFDYENEVYTRNLWIAEGFTEYYGLLAVRRAGLTTDAEFLGSTRDSRHHKTGSLSGLIEKLQTTPGRAVQSVALASFDAWIKLYRPDENSVNTSMSYYTKGAVIAWLLDVRIRCATDDGKSLDDVMRLAHDLFGGDRGFSTEQFCSLCQKVAGTDLKEWFAHATDTTEELDYSQALEWLGLRFKPPGNAVSKAWTGFATKRERGRLTVTHVRRDTAAWEAGISPGDEILGVNNFRVYGEEWEERLEQYHPGEEIALLVSRRDRLITIAIRLEQEPVNHWLLEANPEADAVQKGHLARWLGV
jgi:predicted metalloprotease with PDZ domain